MRRPVLAYIGEGDGEAEGGSAGHGCDDHGHDDTGMASWR